MNTYFVKKLEISQDNLIYIACCCIYFSWALTKRLKLFSRLLK